MKRIYYFLVLLLASPVIADEVVQFGIQGVAKPSVLENTWKPFLKDMSAAIEKPVKPVFHIDYQSTIADLKDKKIDLAWVGNRSAIDAVDSADASIFVKVMHAFNIPGYYSLLITQKDSPYNSLADIKENKNTIKFGFGSRTSTSGTTVPLYYLFTKQGFSHYQLKSYRHANHETNFLEVASDKIDVATISSGMLRRFKDHYPDEYDKLKVIWTSPLIPSDPFIWRNDLSAELKDKTKAFLLAYGNKTPGKQQEQVVSEQAILQQMKWTGFLPSSNSQLQYIRVLNLFGQLESVKNDKSLTVEERNTKVTELEQKISILESGKK